MEPRNRKMVTGIDVVLVLIAVIASVTAGWFAYAYMDARDDRAQLQRDLQQCHDSRVELSDQKGYNRGLYSLNSMSTEAALETLPGN